MASRQEEKEARRQERMAQEEAERRAAGRRKRLQLVAGALLAAIAVVAVVLIVGSGGGDDGGGGKPTKASATDVKLPERGDITDLDAAAKAAGCTVANPPDEGRGHENKTFTASDYKTNPPTSGTHYPQWADDGIYTEDTVPQLGMLVHTLEHGRIDVQYKPGTSPKVIKQLEAFLAESDNGRHMLLFPNTTEMDAQVAATAWDHSLTCPSVNNKIWDALRSFRERYIDRGPETVP
jgi:hypothetical protein